MKLPHAYFRTYIEACSHNLILCSICAGGVGWGEVINGGFGLLLDGSEDAERRARSMLHWDVNNGVSVHTLVPFALCSNIHGLQTVEGVQDFGRTHYRWLVVRNCFHRMGKWTLTTFQCCTVPGRI